MIKTLKKFLIFAGIVIICQLNPYKFVLADNVSTASKVQITSIKDVSKTSPPQDTSKPPTGNNASKISKSQDTTKSPIVQGESDSSKVEDTFAFSSANVDNVNNVSVNKTWTIQFSQPIDVSSTKSSVKIIDKKTSKEVPVNISLIRNNFYMTISTVSPYNPDNYYLLSIDSSLRSTHNKFLKTHFSMSFKTGSITLIDNINATINQGDSYKLPDEVTANMYSGEKKQVRVTWDKLFSNSNVPGNYVYQGNVEGYDKKVSLKLTINASNKNNLESISNTSAWIWQIQNEVDTYGGIDNLISKLKSLGITNVCIKYNEGSRSVASNGMDFKSDFLKYVDNFKGAGFKIGTWGYNHFDNVEAEANLIIDAINNSDYYVFDAEDAVVGKTEQAEEVCKFVRNKCPNAVIGYTSFPIASYHEDIPYSVFNKYCDFTAPQCYWGEMKWTVNKCIDNMLQDYKNYGLDKPIYPLIQTYNVDYSDYVAYLAYKFKCTGLWSLDDLGNTCLDFLNSEGNKLNN